LARHSRHIPQRGAAAAEGLRRDKCVRSKLGAVSRCAEKGDLYLFSGTERGVSDQGRYDKRQKAPRLWDRTPDAVLTVGS